MRRISILTAILALTGVLAACGGATGDQTQPPTVSPDRAQVIAENMLTAYNSGDYQAFRRDWSGPMRFVIRERAFQRFREENLPVTGRFTRLITVTPTPGQQDTDHASYQVHAQFEEQDGVLFTMTLSADGATVEGLEFQAQS
jgi:hypothetical protein